MVFMSIAYLRLRHTKSFNGTERAADIASPTEEQPMTEVDPLNRQWVREDGPFMNVRPGRLVWVYTAKPVIEITVVRATTLNYNSGTALTMNYSGRVRSVLTCVTCARV